MQTGVDGIATAEQRAPASSGSPNGQTLAELAYERLREQLITCVIRPGSTFTESEMAQLLKLGKTPIREAFLRLRLEGLVRVHSRTGYSAAPATLKDARDICALRSILERETVRRVANHPELAERVLLELDEELARIAKAGGVDRPQLIEADRRFHVALARIAGNERLLDAVENALVHFARLSYLSAEVDRGVSFMRHTHRDLISAISTGNGDLARDLVAAEVRRAEQTMLEAFISSDSVATTNVSVATPMHRFYLDIPKDGPPTEDSGGKPK